MEEGAGVVIEDKEGGVYAISGISSAAECESRTGGVEGSNVDEIENVGVGTDSG